jgi:hypothetical protein
MVEESAENILWDMKFSQGEAKDSSPTLKISENTLF